MPEAIRSFIHDTFSIHQSRFRSQIVGVGACHADGSCGRCPSDIMHEMKDTARAVVRIGYDGRVHKTFRGHLARERFDHEVRVLRFLETRGCTFVPRLIEVEPENLKIVTSNCGRRVDQLSAERQAEVFAELEQFGVQHEDRELRNITYRVMDGRFCVIDFEFATLLDGGDGKPVSLKPTG